MSKRPHSRLKRNASKVQSISKKSRSNNYTSLKRSTIGRSGSAIGVVAVFVVAFLRALFGGDVSDGPVHEPIKPTISYEYGTHLNMSDDDVDTTVNYDARDKYTVLYGKGQDEVTVMIYMIGSDLESQYGLATSDLNEMLYADLNDNINIVIETGGAKNWQNNVISSEAIERYEISSKGIKRLDSKMAYKSMTNPESLKEFLNYASTHYPANRNILILWDHGGGSISGYGHDENYRSSSSMRVDEIASAIDASDLKFDIIGFDACLMGNIETALALEPYADYLLASEELEPGSGWYYTDWLSMLDEKTDISSVSLAKRIIDDYINNTRITSSSSAMTLSLVDLSEINSVLLKPLSNFSQNILDELENEGYSNVVDARIESREFAESTRIDQIDLADFALKLDTKESDDLVKAVDQVVKYNRCYNITNAYGLSIFFPYNNLAKMHDMVEVYGNINMPNDYKEAIRSFASYTSSGQSVVQYSGGTSSSLFDVLFNHETQPAIVDFNDILYILEESYSDSSWFDYRNVDQIARYIDENRLSDSSFKIKEKNGQRVLELKEEDWALMKTIELNVFVDDGEGYIELGRDNVFEYNKEGDLIIDYDASWLSINDHFVPYYMVHEEYISENEYLIMGKIPALLNGKRADVIVSFTNHDPYGVVNGATFNYDDTDISVLAKDSIPIEIGDKLEFLCHYYSYDGQYIDDYILNDPLIVSKELTLENIYISNSGLVYSYCLTDLYGNEYWTEKSIKN